MKLWLNATEDKSDAMVKTTMPIMLPSMVPWLNATEYKRRRARNSA